MLVKTIKKRIRGNVNVVNRRKRELINQGFIFESEREHKITARHKVVKLHEVNMYKTVN